MDNDDMLAPHALLALVEQINIHNDADLTYSGEDKLDTSGDRFEPFFKPSTSPDMLLETRWILSLSPMHPYRISDIGMCW